MVAPVSIIITVFNRTEYLAEAIRSALCQTVRPLEIIVTDDSSNKDIKTICDSFNDSKIRYRNNKERLGVALNLRQAIYEAKGKFIAILNDDDLFEPEFLNKLVVPLEESNNRILVFSDYWFISQDGQIDEKLTDDVSAVYGRDVLPGGDVGNFTEFVLKTNGVPLAMASIFRKDALNLDLLVSEVEGAYDFWISCLLAATGDFAYYIPERLSRYRMHGARETERKAPDRNQNMVYIYDKLIELKLFPTWNKFILRKKGEALRALGVDNLYFDQVSESRKYFIQSVQIELSWKAIAGIIITFLPRQIRQVLKLTKGKAGAGIFL